MTQDEDRIATADRRQPGSDSLRLGDRVGMRMGKDRRTKLGTKGQRGSYLDTARALAAYAMNVAHGAVLAPFELDHVKELAASVGCNITETQRVFGATKLILGEVMIERRRQVELGYTAEKDDANPLKLHDEVMTRVTPLPTVPDARPMLVEAAAIIVAEIERLDRVAAL